MESLKISIDALRKFRRAILLRASCATTLFLLEDKYYGCPNVLVGMTEDLHLGEDAIVFDLGAYNGDYLSKIYAKYSCTVYAFEPVARHYNQMVQMYRGENKKLKFFHYGLASKNSQETLLVDDIASTIFYRGTGRISSFLRARLGSGFEEVRLVNAQDFFLEHKIRHIDCMKIDIEGGEYDLLEYLIAIDWIRRIDQIQIEFHHYLADAEQRRLRILEHISQTHEAVQNMDYIWQHWRKKK